METVEAQNLEEGMEVCLYGRSTIVETVTTENDITTVTDIDGYTTHYPAKRFIKVYS